MKIKRSALIGILVVSLVALLAVGTWAWFTAQADPIENTFTAGTVSINLVDNFTTVTNWNPGDCSDKVVYVENTGTKCAYVRVKLTPAWGHIGEEGFEAEDLAISNVEWEYDSENWTLVDDWYYYNESLEGTATFEATDDDQYDKTTNLIETVCLDGPSTGNAYQGKVFMLTAEAEAIQCKNILEDEQGVTDLPWGVVDSDGVVEE